MKVFISWFGERRIAGVLGTGCLKPSSPSSGFTLLRTSLKGLVGKMQIAKELQSSVWQCSGNLGRSRSEQRNRYHDS